jgi:hypothetical protein
MILYHFTSKDAIPGILIHGLLPREGDRRRVADELPSPDDLEDVLFNIPVVWLTAEPKASPNIVGNLDRLAARISVDISSISTRLKSWPKWLRKWPKEVRDFERETETKFPEVNTGLWYIHFGAISPDRIRAVELATQEKIEIKLDQEINSLAPEIVALKARLERLAIPFIVPNVLQSTNSSPDQTAAQ